MPVGGPLVPCCNPPRRLQSRASALELGWAQNFEELCLVGHPVSSPFSLPAVSASLPFPPPTHAHQCLIHGPRLLLGVGILPLPHVDLQAPLVQDVTVLQVGEKDPGESLRVGTGHKTGSFPQASPGPWHFTCLGESRLGAGGQEVGLGVSRLSYLMTEQVLGEWPRGDFFNHQLSL